MKSGDEVKVFVQIGLMREPKWLIGEISRFHPFADSKNIIVNVSGNRLCLTREKVRLWEPTTQKEIDQFSESGWERLKDAVEKGMKEFFPDEKVSYDDAEKSISVGEHLYISAGSAEIKTIVSFREVPVWVVTEYVGVPATRWEPEDVSENERGSSANPVSAAKIFVDSLWNAKAEGFWESLHYDSVTPDLY